MQNEANLKIKIESEIDQAKKQTIEYFRLLNYNPTYLELNPNSLSRESVIFLSFYLRILLDSFFKLLGPSRDVIMAHSLMIEKIRKMKEEIENEC